MRMKLSWPDSEALRAAMPIMEEHYHAVQPLILGKMEAQLPASSSHLRARVMFSFSQKLL